MTNKPISGLNPGGPVEDTDLFPDVQQVGVGPVKVTGAQIKTYTSDNPVLVNPNIGDATGTSISLNTSGSYSTTIESSGSSTQSWTFVLPPDDGTNGYILTTNGSGVSSWTNPTALGIDIDINSTGITGGTSGRVLYDNAGTVGEISAITTNGSDTLTVGSQQTTQGNIVLSNTAAGAFPVTVKSSNSTSAAWSLTLPATAGTNKYSLTTDGSGISSWSQIDLSAAVTGTLPVNHGGTGQTSLSAHGVVIGNSTSGVNVTATGSAGQVFQSGGSLADPVWSTATFAATATSAGTILRADGTNWVATTATYPSTTTINQILYSDANNEVTGLTTANGGVVNTNSSGVPSVTANPTLGVQQTTQGSLILANTAAGAFSTTLKSSNSASEAWTLTLPVSKGSNGYILTTDGTGVSSWTNPTALGIDIDVNSTAITGGTSGRIVYDNAGTFGEISAITTNGSDTLTLGVQQTTQGKIVLDNTAAGAFATTLQSSNSSSAAWTLTLPTTAGTNNYVLTTNGSGVSSWSQVSLTAGVTGVLPAANGGTGNSTNTLHGVLIGNAGSAINATSAGSSGQILQSSGASADPTWTTATFPSTATGTGTILRADGTNWSATTATYPSTTTAGTLLTSASANAITASATPTLGVAGSTVGSLGFANATSGSITLSPVTGALGTTTITMPATTGTMTVLGNSTTGSGNIVLATSPTLATPTLGVASATSINKVAITQPSSGSTLTISDGKTLSASASVTIAGTDSTTITSSASTTLSGGTIREALSADRNYYVATTGSDSNNGLSAGSPFLTLQKAWDTSLTLDLKGNNVNINIADGTYTGGVLMSNQPVGGSVFFIGNSSTPSNVIISTTNNNCFTINVPSKVAIRYLKMTTTTGGSCINVSGQAQITINNVEFGSSAASHMWCDGPGSITVDAGSNYTISGSAFAHVRLNTGSTFQHIVGTITVSGTPNFSGSFIYTTTNTTVQVYNLTFSGSATGRRYYVITGAQVSTTGGGANYFPGNVAGIADAATYGAYS